MMIKGIIFDLDGTTIYTIEDLTDAVNYIREYYGFEKIDCAKTMSLVGHGLRNLVEVSLPIKGKQDEAFKMFMEYYGNHYMDKTYAYDGINELLEKLQTKGILLGVNSNKKDEYTKNLMKKLFPTINFVSVIGQREGVNNKPDPTSANEIIRIMNLNNEEVAYVGDSETDIKTAINAKVLPIGVSWGFRSKEVIRDAGAKIIVDKPEEILKLIEEKL